MSTQVHEEPRSIKTQYYGPAESRSGEENIVQQHPFKTNEDLKNYPFINTGASISISTWKFTKHRSHIINGTFNPSFSPISGNDQWFKINVESPSLPEMDTELFYCLVIRL